MNILAIDTHTIENITPDEHAHGGGDGQCKADENKTRLIEPAQGDQDARREPGGGYSSWEKASGQDKKTGLY